MQKRFIRSIFTSILAVILVFGLAFGSLSNTNLTKVSAAADSTSTTAAVVDTYDSTKVYVKGDQVVYQGLTYEAKYWTQGVAPNTNDQWGPWKLVTSVTPTPTPTVTPTTSPTVSPTTSPTGTPMPSKDMKVVAYYPSWANGLNKLRFDIVTHAIYAFAIPTSEGGLLALENPDNAKQMITKAHANGAKASIAIGGWSYNGTPLEGTFKQATNTDDKIKKFADAIIKLCDDYGFDGVDMDWEHPRRDDGTSQQYEKLMLYLAGELHKKGKILTSAVLSGATPDGNIYYDAAAHTDKVLAAVDWINVMAYDGGDGERHSSYNFAVACGDYWHNTRQMPKEKVVLGVPFYARPSWASYESILASDPTAYSRDITTYNGMQAYYNGIDTIKKKSTYAKANLGGIMIWEISHDTTDQSKSLLTAIGEVFNQ